MCAIESYESCRGERAEPKRGVGRKTIEMVAGNVGAADPQSEGWGE